MLSLIWVEKRHEIARPYSRSARASDRRAVLAAYRDDAIWYATVYPVFSETARRTFSAFIPGIASGAFFRWYANHLMTRLKDE